MFQALHALSLPIKRQTDRSRPHSAASYLQDLASSRGMSPRSQPQILSNPYGSIFPTIDYGQRPTSSQTAPIPPVSSVFANVERPFTAPVATSQMLPPKRQLPFPVPKPRSTPSSTMQQSSTTKGQVKKKAPTKAQPRPKPNTPRKLKAPAVAKNVPLPGMTTTTSSQAIAVQAPEALNSAESWNPPPSAHANPELTLASSQVRRVNNDSLSQQSQDLDLPSLVAPILQPTPPQEGFSKNAVDMMHRNTSAMSDNAAKESPLRFEELSSPVKTSSAIDSLPSEDLVFRLNTLVRQYQDSSISSSSVPDKSGLADYASKPDDERQALIDNFVCTCLEDENFMKLAEDVCVSLMRIGLVPQ